MKSRGRKCGEEHPTLKVKNEYVLKRIVYCFRNKFKDKEECLLFSFKLSVVALSLYAHRGSQSSLIRSYK